jgi:hypothetical protein
MKKDFISIINEGANMTDTNAVYIGRPSKFQNPFPTKPSKFSTLKYSHEESMKMFFKYFEKEITTNKELIKNINFMLDNNSNLILSCFCIHRKFNLEEYKKFNLLDVTCHGEIISYFIFKYFLL